MYSAPVDDTVTSPHHDHITTTETVEEVENVAETTVPSHVNSHSVQDHNEAGDKKKVATKRPKFIEILESDNVHEADGSYSFHYRGEDGSFREETAVVKNAGTKNQYLEVTGAYSFFDADGKEVVVHYKADDRGFVPVGSNIPDAISVAAKENSQLPSMYDDLDEDENEEDLVPLKEKSN